MPRERKVSVKAKNNSNSANDGNDDNVKCVTNKKRRTSTAITNNVNSNQNNVNNKNNNQASELIPPQPVSTFGDRIVVSNPFDDTCAPHTPHTPVSHNSHTTHTTHNRDQRSQTQCQSAPQSSVPQSRTTPTQSPPLSNRGCNTPLAPIAALPPPSAPTVASKPVPLMSGKIYPAEQSMVFNPANPNAPPIYPCGTCHKEVHDNDQAILCESGCNFWFHRICTGISERAYFLLTQEVYAEWVCDKCLATKQIPLVKFKP